MCFKGWPTLLESNSSVDEEEACLELSSQGFCLMPGRRTKRGRSWVAHQSETIKHHSQRSRHLLQVVSTSRVQNGTCLKQFKRFLNFPLQAKYQSCKKTYSRQISPLSAGEVSLTAGKEQGVQIHYNNAHLVLPLSQQLEAEGKRTHRTHACLETFLFSMVQAS